MQQILSHIKRTKYQDMRIKTQANNINQITVSI